MSSIDERIVRMQFDNQKFEAGVHTSLKSLDALKKGLNFNESVKSLSNLEKSTSKFSLNGIRESVEDISSRFSNLGIVGMTVIQRITNAAVTAGNRIAKAFTIDPVKTGFQEYETQINAIQTILANTESKGSTLQDVNNALAELNAYADKTIYNFTEMTRNIGTFTAAGVELNTSVSAIKGIANLAAISGSNAQQASTAMYQLSQALAAGTVKLMDWNSVVNAGMGGQVFQDALKETARVHGIAIDEMIKSEGSFRETLQNGWLSSEILTETLAKFTGDLNEQQLKTMGYTDEQIKSIIKMGQTANDAATKVKTFTQLFDTLKEAAQSGWTQSWQIIVGDFEEAKDLLTSISDAFSGLLSSSAEARNKVLTEGLSSGWKQLLAQGIADEEGYIESIKNVAKERGIAVEKMIKDSGSFQKSLKEGWLTSDILAESLADLTNKTKGLSDEELANLGYTRQQIDALEDLNASVKNGSVSLDDFAKKMSRPSGRENMIEGFKNSFKALGDILKAIGSAFKEVFPPMTGEQLYEITERFRALTENFKIGEPTINAIKNTFKGFFSIVKVGVTVVKTLATAAIKLLEFLFPIGEGVLSITGAFGEFVSGIGKAVTSTNIFSSIIGGLGKLLSSIGNGIKEMLTGNIAPEFQAVFNTISNFMTKVQDAVARFFDGFNFKNFLEIVNEGLLASVLVSLKKFVDLMRDKGSEVKNVLSSFKDILDSVKDSLVAWQTNLKSGTLLKIAAALGILTASVVALSVIDAKNLAKSLGALTVMFIELFAALTVSEGIMGKTGFMQLSKITSAMILFSVAINVLASAMKKVSEVKSFEKGLVGVFALTKMATGTAKKLSAASGDMMKGMTGLIAFAAAINVLASAVRKLSSIKFEDLIVGLTGVGLLITEVSIFLKKTDLNGMSVSKGIGLIALATSIDILSKSVTEFASLDLAGMAKGLTSVGILLAEISLFSQKTTKPGNLLVLASGLTVLSVALVAFSHSVKTLGNMSLASLGKGLGTIAAGLTILAVGLKAMNNTLKGSAALTVAAAALTVLAPALVLLGGMSIGGIVKSLLSLGGALTVLGVAAAALTPVLPAMLGLATALTLIGVAVAATGAGLLAIGTGITAVAVGLGSLATLGSAGAVAAANSISLIITEVAKLIPTILAKIGEGIVLFAQAIGNGAPALFNAFKSILLSFVDAITVTIPKVVSMIGEMISQLLLAIGSKLPEIMDAGFKIIISFLEGVARNIQSVVEAGIEIVVNFIEGVTSKISSLIDAGVKLVIAFLNGLAKAIDENAYIFGEALYRVLKSIIKAAVQIPLAFVNSFVEDGKKLIGGIISGIRKKFGQMKTAAKEAINKFIAGVKSKAKDLVQAGRDVITGFINGIKEKASALWDKAKEIGSGFVSKVKEALDSHSPSKKMHKVGVDACQGFINGVKDMKKHILHATTETFKEVPETAEQAISRIGNAMNYGKKAFQAYINQFGYFKPSYEETSDAIQRVSDAITEYGVKLYKESDRYKQDTATVKEHKKELEKLQASRIKMNKELEELNKNGVKSSDKRVQKLKSDLKDVDKAIKESKKQIIQDQKDIAKHTKEAYLQVRKSIMDSIKGTLDPLKANLDTQIDLFKKFGSDTEVTATEILENMTSQIVGIKEWNADLEALVAKGFAKGLIDQLKAMGPSGANHVKAFMQMTKEEMELANQMFQESSKMTSEQLIKSFDESLNAAKNWAANIEKLASKGLNDNILKGLSELGIEGSKYIDAFLNMTTEQIVEFNNKYKESLKLPANIADSVLASLSFANKNPLSGIAGKLLDSINPDGKTGETVIQNGTKLAETFMVAMSTGMDNKKSELKTKATDVSKSTYGGLKQHMSNTKGRMLGTEVCNGMIAGLESGRSGVTAAARRVAREAFEAAMKELEINSPSKKFEIIGRYSDMGMAKGLLKFSHLVTSSASEVGKSALSGMQDAIHKIGETISSGIDVEPTIRPVLDLTDIRSKAGLIGSMLNPGRGLNISGIASKADSVNSAIRESSYSGKGSKPVEKSMEFNQYNYSPKALSRIDIYRQTKNQFSAAKGVLDSL